MAAGPEMSDSAIGEPGDGAGTDVDGIEGARRFERRVLADAGGGTTRGT